MFFPIELFFQTDLSSHGSAVQPCQQPYCQNLSGGRQMQTQKALVLAAQGSHCLTELHSQEEATSKTPLELS